MGKIKHLSSGRVGRRHLATGCDCLKRFVLQLFLSVQF